ncbi:hypothetical protein ACQ4PT_021533 [Festuca glaucescens]
MAHWQHPADFSSAEANQLIPRSDNHISGTSASTSLRVPFIGNVSSPSKRARMDGLVPDAEEAQHHRVPLRHESSVPSGSVPQNCVRISAPTFVENASSTSRGGRMDGFVADAEGVQHHRVPLRQASSIPSDNNGKQVLGDSSAGFNHGQEYEGDFIHGDISDTELSHKELFDNIKDLKEKTVADEGHVSEDEITAYSRCSVPYLITVFKSITCSHHRKELVKMIGFQHMLDLDDCNVPRLFAQFIADNTNPDVEAIIIGQKSIPIDPKSFELVLGIPAGQLPVETDEEADKFGFLSLFGLSEVRYLDFIDFGSISLPSTIPRISVWKGKLIKHFSEMDKGRDGYYGNCPDAPHLKSKSEEKERRSSSVISLNHEPSDCISLNHMPSEDDGNNLSANGDKLTLQTRINDAKPLEKPQSQLPLKNHHELNFPALYHSHWFLFAVDMKARKFLFMDSLFGPGSELHKEVDERMITNFRQIWNECNLKDMHFQDFGKAYP